MDIRTVMVATDFSEASEPATTLAFHLARALGARLYLVHVVPQNDVQLMTAISGQLQSYIKPEVLVETYYANADKRLSELVEHAQAADLIEERLIVTGDPVEEIISWATAKQTQILIVGTHGRSGLERFVLGSVAERVLRQAQCAVLVVPATTA